MANRKTKSAAVASPKTTRHHHSKKPNWVRRILTPLFSSVFAPLLVGLSLQACQRHVWPSAAAEAVATAPAPKASAPRVEDARPEAGDLYRTAAQGPKSY